MVGICVADNSAVWVSVMLSYKGLLLVIGVILSLETRSIKIPELNESFIVGAVIYTIFILSATLALIGFLLVDYVTIRYALIGLLINIGTTVILGIIFIPKVGTV